MYSESFASLSLLDGLKDSLLGIAVVFLMLAVLIVVISVMGKLGLGKKKEARPVSTGTVKSLPAYPDTVDLINVDEKTAAMIMAIVADETEIPLSELRFISIREL
ncbi:MAG: OadG family protein [Clostridia bacterium]|nr:OadG family protein [Clostridia bacterium]